MKAKSFRKAFNFLNAKERRRGVFLLCLMVLSVLMEAVGISVLIPFIALLVDNDGPPNAALKYINDIFGNPPQMVLIIGGLIVITLVYLVKNAFLIYFYWVQANFIFNLRDRLSGRLALLYLRQPYEFHLNRNSAELIQNVTREVELFIIYMVSPVMTLLTEGFVLIGIIFLLFIIEPMGVMTVSLILGLIALFFIKITKHYLSNMGQTRHYYARLAMQHLQQSIGSTREARMLGCEEVLYQQFHKHNSFSLKAEMVQSFIGQVPRLLLEFFAVLGFVLLTSVMLLNGASTNSVIPVLTLFTVAAFRLIPSVNRMLNSVQSMQYADPVLDSLERDLSLPMPVEYENKLKCPVFSSGIRLVNISYSYPFCQANTLSRVSIEIGRRESIGIVGSTGSGKTTLVDIILGLLYPNSGSVLVDGFDISGDLAGWRSQVGYVPQSIYLIDASIRQNIAFGVPDHLIDDAAINRAINAAQLVGFIETLTQGLETQIGERGVRLSGGQRQRLAIARALYSDPAIILFDEATSALDNDTESHLMNSINALQGKKTLIMVTHRLSTIADCDRIYRIHNGQAELI